MNLLSNFLCLQWKEKTLCTGKELSWGGQKSNNTPVQILQGIRLWFLPGVAEILLEMIPEPGETRFGMDIKRIDEVTNITALGSHDLQLIFKKNSYRIN